MKFTDPYIVLSCSTLVAVVGIVIKSIEDLRKHQLFSEQGLLSWKILETYARYPVLARFVINTIFKNSFGMTSFLVARIVIGLACIILLLIDLKTNHIGHFTFSCLATLLLAHHLFYLRTRLGMDGSFQMSSLILASYCIAFVSPSTASFTVACFFVCSQLILSYLIAGTAKIRSWKWRKGIAIPQILWTHTYGIGMTLPPTRTVNVVGLVLCWFTMLFQITFPFALVNHPATISWMFMGILFHFGTAVLMGLNGFLFAFIAAYPTLIFTRQFISNYVT